MVLTILITFISLISLLVLHEFSHFILAKKFGVKVEEFGIGYPPRLIGKKIGETIYSINLLPFGAFVKILGEEERLDDPRSFNKKPIWQRVLIVLAGVVSFWLISAILLSVVFGMGLPQAISDEENGNLVNPRVQIVAVAFESPAEEVGIRTGDIIRKFEIRNLKFEISKVKELQELTEKYKGEEITLTIERGKEIFDVKLVPRVSPPEGEGPMGIGLARTIIVSYPWYSAGLKGIEATGIMTGRTVVGLAQVLGNLIQGKGLPPGTELAGPVRIGQMMVQAAEAGINYYLPFISMISIYLALFNVLPIPALDGGKLLFLAIEKFKGKPVNPKIEQRITAFFFFMLVLLAIWVTIKDITRLF